LQWPYKRVLLFFMVNNLLRYNILFLIVLLNSLFAKGEDYYWVGGEGYWSDTSHWSSSFGGIPTVDDNVYFNENSFNIKDEVVTIDVAAFCKNMDWSSVTQTPILAGNNNLSISGSLILKSDITVSFSGGIIFIANEGLHIIKTVGQVLSSDIYFNGTGSWDLFDNFDNGTRSINLNKGTLNTKGNIVNCGSFLSESNNTRTMMLGASTFNIISFNGQWIVNDQLNLIKENCIIKFEHPDFVAKHTFNGGGLDYNSVVFMNDGIIRSSNTYENLYLNSNHRYELESGETQTIVENFYARGCTGLIDIWASNDYHASIAYNSGDINVSFVTLKYINAIVPSGVFNAFHSLDFGNNQNCLIHPDSRDMYWINNTGNWSDTLHWNSTPAGPDADCVPILIDNVFFNETSFSGQDTVNVDLPGIYCNNMTWTGNDNSVFYSTMMDVSLNIYGSLEFSPHMTNDFDGRVIFRDTLAGKTIKSSGTVFNNDLIFHGKNGGWLLLDSLQTDGNIYFNNGSLYTVDNFLRCKTFHSDSSNVRSLSLGSSIINITSSSPVPAWSVNDTNLNINAGTSLIDLRARNATMKNYGSDTIDYYNVIFSSEFRIAKLETESPHYARFHKVIFNSNAEIKSGANSFDTLSFSPGCFYELESGSIQTINYDIYPSGICEGPILLQSTTNGSQAKIKTTDTLEVEYTSIRDINAIGEAEYLAYNSFDIGNNSGWDNVQTSAPGKLFWVGGDGDWSDPMHWDTISNGPGGLCIPTPYDTVIFDQNSFSDIGQKVNIDLNNAFAHNMNWSQADYLPEFSGSYPFSRYYYLRIYGSLEFTPDMYFSFPGEIYFEARDPNQTIITKGVKLHNFNNNVYFNGIGGEWTLIDSLDLGKSKANQNYIYFYQGNLNTNNQAVTCFTFNSYVTTNRLLSLDSSEVNVYNDWFVRGDNLIVDENYSLIRVDSGEFIHNYGNYYPYNDVYLTSLDDYQKVICSYGADSVIFNNVIFSYDGEMSGNGGSVIADSVLFLGEGWINNNTSNIYNIDSLIFTSIGHIYGNDTLNFTKFDSLAYINGSSEFTDALLLNNGEILGYNRFDTITVSPSYTYELEGGAVQTITDEFNIWGNNCESIWLQSTSTTLAEVYKESGSVYGEFIEMTNIRATGDAIFDAGYFSNDIDNSNEGWIFHDFPDRYSLGPDTTILEGDTVYFCTNNFYGNSGTTYLWQNFTTGGDTIGYDSCLMVTESGYYGVIVFYDEGPGCIRYDTIFIGCYLGLDFDTTNVSCYDFDNGAIEMEIEIGIDPFEIGWYKDGILVDTTQNIYNLTAGMYNLSIEDSIGCISIENIPLTQPDSLHMVYETVDACYDTENGIIFIDIAGGTEPYDISWDNNSNDTLLTDLKPDTYNVTIIDAHNCPAISESIVLNEYPELVFSLIGSDLICYNDSSGTIEVNGLSGGTGNYANYLWYKNSDFFTNGQYHNLENLASGNYSLTIEDDLGCFRIEEILISQPDELTIELIPKGGTNDLGSVDMTVTGGTSPYTYYWNNGDNTEDINMLTGGDYLVEVTDNHGCFISKSVFVDVTFRIFAPTGFSPNNDGYNDVFELRGLGTDLKEFELTIFNRWGEIVFETNDFTIPWNGTLYNTGNTLPMDVYTWQSQITFLGGQIHMDKGNVTLIR